MNKLNNNTTIINKNTNTPDPSNFEKFKQYSVTLFKYTFPYPKPNSLESLSNLLIETIFKPNSDDNLQLVRLKNPLSPSLKNAKNQENLLKNFEKGCKLLGITTEDGEKGLVTGAHLVGKDLLLPLIMARRGDFFKTLLEVSLLKNYMFDTTSEELNQNFLKESDLLQSPQHGVLDEAVYLTGANVAINASILLTNGYVEKLAGGLLTPQLETLAIIVLSLPPVKNKIMGDKFFRQISDTSLNCAISLKEIVKKPLTILIKNLTNSSIVDRLYKMFATPFVGELVESDILQNIKTKLVKDNADFIADTIINHSIDGIKNTLKYGMLYRTVQTACSTSPFWTITSMALVGGHKQSMEELSIRVFSVSLLVFTSSTGFVTAVITVPAILTVNYLLSTRNDYVDMKNQERYKEIQQLKTDIGELTCQEDGLDKILGKQLEIQKKLKECVEPETALTAISKFAQSTFYGIKGYFYPGSTPKPEEIKEEVKNDNIDSEIDKTIENIKLLKKKKLDEANELKLKNDKLIQLKKEEEELEKSIKKTSNETKVVEEEVEQIVEENTLRKRKVTKQEEEKVEVNTVDTTPQETAKTKSAWNQFTNYFGDFLDKVNLEDWDTFGH